MNKNIVPITLLTGYLGSGKTTLVNNILFNKKGLKIAVIVNDIGEVNIDASLIQQGGVVTQKDDSLVALSNGCICCTLKTDLMKQITDIIETNRFDYLVIEASGICEPLPIAQTITAMSQMARKYGQLEICRLDCVATVVDALRMRDEFASGTSLTRKNIDEEDIENLLIQQIEFCDVIVLNKIAEISTDELKQVRAVIKTLQPTAEIIETNYSEFDLDKIINSNRFDFQKACMSAGWIQELENSANEEEHDDDDDDEHEHGHHQEHHHHHDEGEAEEYGISTFVYFRREGFRLNDFDDYVARKWSRNIIRCKGILYFKENEEMSYLFEQAGSQKKLRETGQWICTAPQKEQQRLLAESEELRRDWDDEYGDKMVKLVFIGKDMDKATIKADLDKI